MSSVVYQSVHPIGDTEPQNLPVRDLETSISYYQSVLAMSIQSRNTSPYAAAVLGRDTITLGFAENGGDPEQASVYISVSDVDAARAELAERGVDLSPIRLDEHGGKQYRVFFLRAPDGLCYCLGQQV